MNIKILISTFIAIIFSSVITSYGNIPCTVIITPEFNNKPLICNEHLYKIKDEIGVKFNTLKFYISKIKFLQNDSVIFSESNSYHLIDAQNNVSQHIPVKLPDNIIFSEIEFCLGIDSATSVSGAYGGDLDPTNGMYWTWQSGYINFKLEGTYVTNNNSEKFEYHLGGYMDPFNAIQTIKLPVRNTEVIQIALNMNKVIELIEDASTKKIMSPSTEAVFISNHVANSIQTKFE